MPTQVTTKAGWAQEAFAHRLSRHSCARFGVTDCGRSSRL